MVKIATLLMLGVALSGCYNSFEAVDGGAGESAEIPYNITLERLHELTSSQEYFDVTDEVVICGTVTANDVGGNFYLSFVIEQDGYAVEVLEGLNYTYVRYPEGSTIGVDLCGLRLSRSYGVLQVGVAAATGSYYDIDYLGHEVVVDQHITNAGMGEVVTPLSITLEMLYDDSAYEAMCGRLVEVVGVRFQVEEYDLGDRDWGGSRIFVDEEGRELGCYTSEYAAYSGIEIEQGYATMRGILQAGTSGVPMVEMRSLEDYTLIE